MKQIKTKKKVVLRYLSIFVIMFIFEIILIIVISPFIFTYMVKNAEGIYFAFPFFKFNSWIGVKVNDNSIRDIKLILSHEIGHHIWHNCINETIKKKFLELNYNTLCIYNKDINEDFAESYMYYVNQDLVGGTLEICKSKLTFFESIKNNILKC